MLKLGNENVNGGLNIYIPFVADGVLDIPFIGFYATFHRQKVAITLVPLREGVEALPY